MFKHSKDVGSSPVALKYIVFIFVPFASFFVFILDFVHNWIHLFSLACVYVTNTAP